MTAPRFLPTNMLTAMFPQQPNIRNAFVQARKAAWKAERDAEQAKRPSVPKAPRSTKS